MRGETQIRYRSENSGNAFKNNKFMFSTSFLNSDIGSYSVLSYILHGPFNVSRVFMGLKILLRVICHRCISPWFLNIMFMDVSREVITSEH